MRELQMMMMMIMIDDDDDDGDNVGLMSSHVGLTY